MKLFLFSLRQQICIEVAETHIRNGRRKANVPDKRFKGKHNELAQCMIMCSMCVCVFYVCVVCVCFVCVFVGREMLHSSIYRQGIVVGGEKSTFTIMHIEGKREKNI